MKLLSSFTPTFLALAGLLPTALPGAAQGTTLPVSRIAFGSCVKQGQPQPIWEAIHSSRPETFIFLGDNIYGDSFDLEELRGRWAQLGAEPGYQKLKASCRILATWDDHDYGWNDAGADYALKKPSQQLFLDFFDEPKDSPRRRREGIYDSILLGPPERRVQILLLDTRYHRGPLVKDRTRWEAGEGMSGPYIPNPDPSTTVLGEDQWTWLEGELRKPAALRLLCSSVQVISNTHRWEKWGNFPHERERLLNLLKDTRANGVVILSGDRHTAEISRLNDFLPYPLYDITSSSLNQPHKWRSEINPHRVGSIYFEVNFGLVEIDWSQPDPVLRIQVRDVAGKVMLQVRLPLSSLQP